MKNAQITRQRLFRLFRPLVAGVLLAVVALPVDAVDLKTSDGNWTFSISGNVNVHYIYSDCESSPVPPPGIIQGLACTGTPSGNNVSNISNGLLPAAFSFGVTTTQNGIDIGAHLGLYPGIVANDGGSPNLQQTVTAVGTHTALATTGLDVRQVYMTFGNTEMGTFTLGRNIGLFGAAVILNDMTLPGVGVAGGPSGAAPANRTLGPVGLGTTGLFVLSSDGLGNKRSSSGYMAQATYKFGDLKLGANYGVSKLDCANAADCAALPILVAKNRKVTVGGYYSLTKNLTLLAEVSDVHADAQSGASNHSKNGNVGAFFSF